MALFDDLFNKLFPERQKNRPVEVQEELRRSESYLQAYTEWKNSGQAVELMRKVEKSYEMKKGGIEGLYPIHLFNSAAANGFALSYHPTISRQEFRFLLDYLRDRVLALGYRLANTDHQIRDKETYIQTTEKHYLKPPISRAAAKKSEQRYGNILLEYVLIDNQPSYLKLMVTIYTDHLYSKAQSYDELIEKLFVHI